MGGASRKNRQTLKASNFPLPSANLQTTQRITSCSPRVGRPSYLPKPGEVEGIDFVLKVFIDGGGRHR